MAIDERSRHELYLRAEEALGPTAANTLMEHLPPVGWADVATKRDLDSLRHEIVGTMRAEFAGQTRMMFLAIVSIVLTMSGLTFGLTVTLAR
jgi:hypothetical protein